MFIISLYIVTGLVVGGFTRKSVAGKNKFDMAQYLINHRRFTLFSVQLSFHDLFSMIIAVA